MLSTLKGRAIVTRLNLDAIRRRVSAATPGAWKTGNRFGTGTLGSAVAVISGNLPPLELDPRRNGRNDAAFIAHARQDVPALLAEVDRRPDITPREAAALDRLLHAYVGNDDTDPGMADLRTLHDKVRQLYQDHTDYERVLAEAWAAERKEKIQAFEATLEEVEWARNSGGGSVDVGLVDALTEAANVVLGYIHRETGWLKDGPPGADMGS